VSSLLHPTTHWHTPRPRANGAPAVRVEYIPERQADQALAHDCLLKLFRFGAEHYSVPDDPRQLGIGLVPLSEERCVEVWRADSPTWRATEQGISMAGTATVLVGHILLDESQFANLGEAANHVYRRILRTVGRRGYPHLLRAWNYFPRISQPDESLERYQSFCLGRHEALCTRDGFEVDLPAASAVGSLGAGVLLVYFIATRAPGIQVENRRQMSAFRYPQRYGPRAPSFSRAKLMAWPGLRQLYISGTASIVGHQTRHAGDVSAQIGETVANLRALIEGARDDHGFRTSFPSGIDALKVYVRDPADFPLVRKRLESELGTATPAVFLQGEVCRAELRVEVEALCTERPE